MSAPNKQYDPVEVAVLSPDDVAGMRDAALAAIAAASDLDELKTARIAHAGDRSPLALANAEIGALPPQARAGAGKRVGAARREVAQALAATKNFPGVTGAITMGENHNPIKGVTVIKVDQGQFAYQTTINP